jgi:hypothetical protein
MSTPEVPSEAARRKFVDKLTQFRGSLDAEEQRMLDSLVQTARQAHERGDVELYWFTAGLPGAGTPPGGDPTNLWAGYPGGQGEWQNTPFS